MPDRQPIRVYLHIWIIESSHSGHSAKVLARISMGSRNKNAYGKAQNIRYSRTDFLA